MASKKFTRLFKVLYDFHAEDEGELSVIAGEIVRAKATEEDDMYGWIAVETVSPPFSKGYVPKDYVAPAETATSVGRSPQQTKIEVESVVDSPSRRGSGSSQKPATPGYVGSTIGSPEIMPQNRRRTMSREKLVNKTPARHSISSARNYQRHGDLVDTPAASSVAHRSKLTGQGAGQRPHSSRSTGIENAHSRPTTPSSPSGRRMAFVGDFAPHVEEHDKWLREIMTMREENHEKLQRGLDQLAHQLQQVHERSTDTMRKMDKLESMVETERRQWRDRLDAEKLASTNQIAKRFGLDTIA